MDTSYDEGVFWGIGSDLNLLPSGEMIICHPVKVSMGQTIDPNDSVWKNVVDDRMGRWCAGSFTSLCIRVLLQHKLNVGLTWITLHEQHCLHLITKICPDTNLGPPLWSTLSMCTSCHVTTWIPLPESRNCISTVDRAGSRNSVSPIFFFFCGQSLWVSCASVSWRGNMEGSAQCWTVSGFIILWPSHFFVSQSWARVLYRLVCLILVLHSQSVLLVSLSDWLNMSGLEEDEDTAESPGSSRLSMKSDRSKNPPPGFSTDPGPSGKE